MSGSLRSPRLRVLADGSSLPGVLEMDVAANNHLAADRFGLRIAASAVSLADLADPELRLDIQVSLGAGWTRLLLGRPDNVQLDPIGGVLSIEGRDLAALLIEAPLSEAFVNRTASEIAETLAARHGLQPRVESTSATVGRADASGRGQLALHQFARCTTEWDLLATLARAEGFDLFLAGDALHFAPPTTDAPKPIRVSDCTAVTLSQSLGLTRPTEVEVRSWTPAKAASARQVVRSEPASGTVLGEGQGTPTRHALVRPGLSAADAGRLAKRTLADLARHARTAGLSMPGEFELTPRDRVALLGAGPSFSGLWRVAELNRSLDVNRGFTQRLRLDTYEEAA